MGLRTGFDRIWSSIVRTPVSAAQLVDIFLDASHFPFVHTATFGTDEAARVCRPRHRNGDDWVVRTVFDTWYRNFDDPLAGTEHAEVQPQVLLKQGDAGAHRLSAADLPGHRLDARHPVLLPAGDGHVDPDLQADRSRRLRR